ncbi:nucleotidyltransferase domain-containing protein [Marinicella gelatinilytica]|uniref:nucleotidyltransferase domain-containing protein n=1 Tax=Marinicella gelatinilytica TaxID=2996017 RepID=UPI0022609931|nr:nucleotidyltransferase domain-containing protein [Marinicella gelatinilytica]MCX7546226.1 nucleotidyltransferase domain-containing protein [Marinicella gelatinilytica]
MKMNQLTMGEALFTKTQQKVLGLLYGQTEKSFYLNEIVKLADMGKGTVRRELDKLSASGLLTVRKQGNQMHYQANSDNPIFHELQGIVKKTFGVVGNIESALQDILPDVTYAFIYGSVAKGSEHAGSDIDLMVIAEDLSYTLLMETLADAEQQLGRPINPTIYSPNEFQKRIKNNQNFITRVLSQDILWIKGEEQFKQNFAA